MNTYRIEYEWEDNKGKRLTNSLLQRASSAAEAERIARTLPNVLTITSVTLVEPSKRASRFVAEAGDFSIKRNPKEEKE